MDKDQRKIGLFGGSFDPVHFGHLNLAIELMEKHSLSEVMFIPTGANPLKDQQPINIEHRLNMVKLAIDPVANFSLVDIEKHRSPPFYLIDTLRSLLEKEHLKENPCQFYLMLGADSLNDFIHWKEAEKITELLPLLVGSRFLKNKIPCLNEAITSAFQEGWTETNCFDISATEIRKRLKNNLFCGHLLPGAVISYIKENHLYSSID